MTLSGAGVQQTSQEPASARPLPPRGPSPDSGEVTSGSEVFRAGVRAPACWLCEARGTKPESKASRPLAERSSTPPNRASALSLTGPPPRPAPFPPRRRTDPRAGRRDRERRGAGPCSALARPPPRPPPQRSPSGRRRLAGVRGAARPADEDDD